MDPAPEPPRCRPRQGCSSGMIWRPLSRPPGAGEADRLHQRVLRPDPPGHVLYLAEAATLGDVLVVGLNSDRSVRSLKGAPRPYQDERARAHILLSLRSVDLVSVFDEPTPLELIRSCRPDILAKAVITARTRWWDGRRWRPSGVRSASYPSIPGSRAPR